MNNSYPYALTLVHSENYNNWFFDASHPTQGRRFGNGRDTIVAAAQTRGIAINEVEPRPATRAELETVHDPAYVTQVLDEFTCAEWHSTQRPDMSELAALFVGGTLTALDALLSGTSLTAVNLPGAKHHAQFDHSSGFCVFADLVIAAKTQTKLGKRVAIFDFDVHHGDGTENLSLTDPNILTYSVHAQNLFPFTGLESQPELAAFNHLLRAGCGDAELLSAAQEFVSLALNFKPDFVFIAAGADGHVNDPLGTLEYSYDGANAAMRCVREAFPDTPILLGGAGGYRPDDDTPSMWSASVMGLVA